MRPVRRLLFLLPASVVPFALGASFGSVWGGAEPASGGLVTLYARDDLQSSFDFRSGSAGGHVEQGEVRLERAQIVYDALQPARISFGFVEDERVEVVDLGADVVNPQRRTRDAAVEFPISVVHTLGFTGVGFSIVAPGGDVDPYRPADRAIGPPPPEGVRHLEPLLGHVYLVRVRRDGASVDEFFAFQVVGILPGHSLTLRWRAAGTSG